MTSAASILALNADRAARLRASWDAYDPLRGVGSPLPRVEVRWSDDKALMLPETMLDDPEIGAGLRWCVETGATLRDLHALNPGNGAADGLTEDDEWAFFCRVRIRYDYEYWCATCVTIEDFDTGQKYPLVLRPAQRASFWAREQVRLAGRAIRQVEVKGRRYGSTTEKRTYVAWLQNIVYQGRHAFLISLDKGGSTAEIARGYELLCEEHPAWAGTLTMENVRGSNTSRKVAETGCMIGMAAVNNPQGASGFPAHFVVFSEMGKMASNEVQSADRLVTNVTSIIPQRPGTAVMMESTGERAGKLFKRYVTEAAQGKGGWDFHFTRWDMDPNCWLPLSESAHAVRAGSVEAWVAGWLAEDGPIAARLRLLWDDGCTLEQVAFFETVAREKPTLEDALQEFPWTWQEAFQYGERRRFRPAHILTHRKTTTEPTRGRLVADTLTGRSALVGIQFVPDPRGELRVWRFPGDRYDFIEDPTTHRYTNAGVAAMDIGGTWEKADYTDVPVLDRRPMAHGAPPEIAAEWHGHLDQDLAAWEAARLCAWYGQAWGPITLAVEVNSLREDQGDEADGLEPDHSLTVLDAISGVYPYLYRRRVYDRTVQGLTDKLGWFTSKQTKARAIDLLSAALREGFEDGGGYIERAREACDEMESYVVLDKGTMAAAEGFKDDRVMTRAILMAVSEEMGACRVFPRTSAADDHAAVGRVGRALL